MLRDSVLDSLLVDQGFACEVNEDVIERRLCYFDRRDFRAQVVTGRGHFRNPVLRLETLARSSLPSGDKASAPPRPLSSATSLSVTGSSKPTSTTSPPAIASFNFGIESRTTRWPWWRIVTLSARYSASLTSFVATITVDP